MAAMFSTARNYPFLELEKIILLLFLPLLTQGRDRERA